MRCAECGGQTVETAQTCVLCGAPVAGPPSAAAESAAGGTGDTVALLAAATVLWLRQDLRKIRPRPSDWCSVVVMASEPGTRTLTLDAPWDGYPRELTVRLAWRPTLGMPQVGESVEFYGRPDGTGTLLVESPAWRGMIAGRGTRQPTPSADPQRPPDASAQRAKPARRNGLILTAVGLVGLVAVIVAIAVANSPSGVQLSSDQLKAGDCLTGSNLGLDTSNLWPDTVSAVPCTQQHIAEVFFAGNIWPQSASYPGDNAISNQSLARCQSAFQAYDGVDFSDSNLSFDYVTPAGSDDWASGDRLVMCVAYMADHSAPGGGSPIKYSIKGSGQ